MLYVFKSIFEDEVERFIVFIFILPIFLYKYPGFNGSGNKEQNRTQNKELTIYLHPRPYLIQGGYGWILYESKPQ